MPYVFGSHKNFGFFIKIPTQPFDRLFDRALQLPDEAFFEQPATTRCNYTASTTLSGLDDWTVEQPPEEKGGECERKRGRIGKSGTLLALLAQPVRPYQHSKRTCCVPMMDILHAPSAVPTRSCHEAPFPPPGPATRY